MKSVNGKKIAQKIKKEVKIKIKKLKLLPSLHVISVGENKILKVFLSQKEKACQEVGINFYPQQLEETVKAKKVIELIRSLNFDPKVTGILIQLPLPSRSDLVLCDQISPKKDVDCLTSSSFGRFVSGIPLFVPPTAQAITQLLKAEKIKVKGKKITVVGAGRIAGLPISISLLQQGATITVCHEFTKNLKEHTKKADILISATGQPGTIKGSMVKKGVVIIDVGTSWVKGKLTGDVDIQSIESKASLVTPVPGGVGPVMVACLLRNVLRAAQVEF